MSQVKYRNYTFPSNWSNSINVGAPENRVKSITFPGVKGMLALNMNQAGRPVVHTGTVRKTTQALLYSTRNAIESLCDGAISSAAGGGGTSFGLIFHGTQSLNSVIANGVQWGRMFRACGNGGISSTNTDYYGLPFTINYTQLHPAG